MDIPLKQSPTLSPVAIFKPVMPYKWSQKLMKSALIKYPGGAFHCHHEPAFLNISHIDVAKCAMMKVRNVLYMSTSGGNMDIFLPFQ